jgi:hypothetical protein
MAVFFDERLDLGYLVTGQDGEVALDLVQQAKVLGGEGERLGAGDVAELLHAAGFLSGPVRKSPSKFFCRHC